ncbi:hypothetical protein [Kitasatospora kifunensis]|uniref:Uncharacterized protein n=1 Tax=Kitasatospora kifunensis TaxID=58351 RepID=A0A7W7QYR3_KITKI|nr:hypothetical protein [Kitasatospora kifunensis]MBB4922285.1 hypothetical protein [Kitasatospora kifunensis]
MTLYPAELAKRFAITIAEIQRRLTRLESRTAAIDSGWPLAALPAVIDSGYTSGDPSAYINGATALTGPYQHLTSYSPTAGDSVLALPVGTNQTYVILGKLA